jgi:hypothetical protein
VRDFDWVMVNQLCLAEVALAVLTYPAVVFAGVVFADFKSQMNTDVVFLL